MPISDHIKPEPNPPLTRERVIQIRELYAEGFTVARILAQAQTSLGTLYACLDGAPFGVDGEQWPLLPRRRQTLHKKRRALKADATSLANRLTRTAERQVRDVEVRLSARSQSPTDRERDVRMLAQLARTLRDLRVLSLTEQGDGRKAQGASEEPARSVEELRAAVARKLEAVIADRDHEAG